MTSTAGRALLDRRPIYVPDAAQNQLLERTQGGRRIGTLFCLPTYSFSPAHRGAPRGVLSLSSNEDDGFTESDRAFITACADVLSLVEFYIEIFEHIPGPETTAAATATAAPGVEPASDVAELPPAHGDPSE